MTALQVDPMEAEAFLELIHAGVRPINAGIEVGWTIRQVDQVLADPEFSELIEVANRRLIEDIELVVYQRAKAGNRWAAELVLFNRAADRWAPPTRKVDIRQHAIHEGVVLSVASTVKELIERHGPAALQPGGVLDVDEV
jgi:hypothetical protein